uniref:Si:ch1073-349o24.2 n=1 Tax=Amphilophus citrinellus TaxID=61819 RepID=A0A3Q0RYE1_AMPCI
CEIYLNSCVFKLTERNDTSRLLVVKAWLLVVASVNGSYDLQCEYEDSIEFQGKEGSFQVCLRGIIPCHTLEVPESVMLPLCAVEHSTHTDFLLKNASKRHTCFQWECPAPFQLRPEQGLLKPGQECNITVVFRPQDALVYQQQAYCRFGEEGKRESCCTVLLQGLENGAPVVAFGPVAVGKSSQKHFDIFNPSPVGTTHRHTNANAQAQWPSPTNLCTLSYINENCPSVSLSSSVVDFECIEEGGSVVRIVELVNTSAAKAIYQWDIDCSGNSVFSILPASGTVLPHSHTRVKAVYRPSQPNMHHRKVACLILDGNPVFLDLIGTCHSEHHIPTILKPEHLVLHKLHCDCRQTSLHTQGALQEHHNIQFDQKGVHSPVEEVCFQTQEQMSCFSM